MNIAKSPWVLHYDGSSCNGCDIEVLATMTPMYDVERFGIINTGNPKHADVLLLTGGINAQTAPVVRQLYNMMPDPKVVVACGICACDGGIFKDCYNILGGADKVVPVDVYVPGCAVRPEALIEGIVKAVGLLEEKRKKLKESLKQGYCSVDYSKMAIHMLTTMILATSMMLSLQKKLFASRQKRRSKLLQNLQHLQLNPQ